jgi:hypothetical protein
VHYGTTADWYIRSADSSGKVVIQDSGGSVGIGTSSPSSSYKLDVNGSFRATTLYGDGSNLTGITATETDTLATVTSRGATTTNSITASGMMLGDVHGVSGYYGIKNSSVANSGYAVLQYTSGYTLLNCGIGQVLDFRVGNSQAMRLSGNKNLLIGTTTDNGEKLQVNGNADVSGNINANGDFYQNGTQGWSGTITIDQSPAPAIAITVQGGIITNVT